jgi:hypothetical protein
VKRFLVVARRHWVVAMQFSDSPEIMQRAGDLVIISGFLKQNQSLLGEILRPRRITAIPREHAGALKQFSLQQCGYVGLSAPR